MPLWAILTAIIAAISTISVGVAAFFAFRKVSVPAALPDQPASVERHTADTDTVSAPFLDLVRRIGALEADQAALKRRVTEAEEDAERRHRAVMGKITGGRGGRPPKAQLADLEDDSADEGATNRGDDAPQATGWAGLAPFLTQQPQSGAPPRPNGERHGLRPLR